VLLLAALALAVPASAQFGHPLKGSWSGEWTPANGNPVHVLLELTWDGKAIGGTINPGPSAVPMQTATLDPATWRVHIEADKNNTRYEIDGTLENMGAYKRVISGTWSQGAAKGRFKVIRN
jgi:hypothetical protein